MRKSPLTQLVFALAFVVTLFGVSKFPAGIPSLLADDLEQQEAAARKDRYTKWMRSYAEATKIQMGPAGDTRDQFAELVPKPVFRYSDEERFIPDATLWVWTRKSRPVALQKVEGNNHGGGQMWTICFASLSEELVNVKWSQSREYMARKPGVKFIPIPDAEAPADNPRVRTSQMKILKDRFTGQLGASDDGKGGAETRTLPKPIYEYSDPETKLPIGAIFGMSSTGTNPDLLLLIEAREGGDQKLRWEYAYARMTSNSVRVRLDDTEVWSEIGVSSGAHENWLYFFLPREFR